MATAGVRNVGLKIVSILIAALLWLVVSGEQIVDRALRIPLEFTNLPAQLELIGEPPTVVDVRVRGSSGALSRVAAGELVAVLDLKEARPGERFFHLTGADVRAPFGIEVVQVNPSTLLMSFEPSATRMVPVVPSVDGEPAAGFQVGTVTADPATVEVIGPASAVKELTEALTEPVSVTGASSNVTESVTVGVPSPGVRLRTPVNARVTVAVTPAQVEWAVGGIAVKATADEDDVQVLPREVTVHVRGTRDAMGADAGQFAASVDVEGLKPGQYELPVRVEAPAKVGIVRIDPAVVRVRIR